MVPAGGWDAIPKMHAPGFLVVGDAAALMLGVGLYLEGMNYAIGSGVAAAATAAEAVRAGDAGDQVLSSYRRRLERNFVLRDLKAFRNATPLIHKARFHAVYPTLLHGIVEDLYRVDNRRPKPKLASIARRRLRGSGVGIRALASDAYAAFRAFVVG
jgi:electron transfer flavoprotein-quinone oxidoreductase